MWVCRAFTRRNASLAAPGCRSAEQPSRRTGCDSMDQRGEGLIKKRWTAGKMASLSAALDRRLCLLARRPWSSVVGPYREPVGTVYQPEGATLLRLAHATPPACEFRHSAGTIGGQRPRKAKGGPGEAFAACGVCWEDFG